jgi:predicted nuclease of predicted toxin-antitoxin system
LADVGIALRTVHELRQHGHDAVHLNDEQLARLPDSAILEKARQEHRIVLTFDLDFGDLLASGGHPLPSVIICRLHNQTPTVVTPRLLEVLATCAAELTEGAIVTIEDARYRLRRLPIERA